MRRRIAIVDDEQVQLLWLQQLIQRHSRERSIQFEIQTFESAEAFLFQFEEDQNFDLLILDIEMSGMNGMDLAKKIKLLHETIHILFVTGYAEYSLQGYQVDAIDYILKPIDFQDLSRAIDKFIQKVPTKEAFLLLETADAVLRLPIANIISLEARGHETSVKTVSETLTVSKGIGMLEKALSSYPFFKPHRSYLINVDHIIKIRKTEVILSNQVAVPVSRRAYRPLNQIFIDRFKKE